MATPAERKALFPGQSCFPLSPDKSPSPMLTKNGFRMNNQDQLNVIFDIIGTPDEDNLSFVTDSKALEYLNSFE